MSERVQIPAKPPAAAAQSFKPVAPGVLRRKCACGGSGGSGGECADCKKKKLQRRATGQGPEMAPPIVHEVLRSPGQPLDGATRSYFEPRFRHDFSNVRIHTDARASESARSVDALAYTVGSQIAFGRGLYQPGTASGQRLLAHELTHVVQQGNGSPAAGSLRIGPANDAYEHEAGLASMNVFSPGSTGLGRTPGSAPSSMQRACDPANQTESKTACVQSVVIADNDGKNPTTATSIATAKTIWGKCCISLSESATKTVKKASYKTLDESPSNTPTAQETNLFNDAGSSACIQVFAPAMLTQGGIIGKDVSGGGGTYDAGTANPKIVLVEGADGAVLAHEIGHAMGYLAHDANDTVMKPTGHYNVPNKSAVSADVCAKASSGPVLTKKAGPKDCCMTP